MTCLKVSHTHAPIYRVVRAGWPDPLDASFSQSAPDRRWNTPEFPALYCCCSVPVAKAIVRDLFGMGGILLSDLQADYRPRLLEIRWQGTVADVVTPEGLEAVGRSASLARLGLATWSGSHEPWGELAIFVSRSQDQPQLLARRDDAKWLDPS